MRMTLLEAFGIYHPGIIKIVNREHFAATRALIHERFIVSVCSRHAESFINQLLLAPSARIAREHPLIKNFFAYSFSHFVAPE